MVSKPILDFGIGVCLAHCVCVRGDCDVPHQIGEKVSGAIYIWSLLNFIDEF